MADDIARNNILIYVKTGTEHFSPAEQARVDQLGRYAIALGWEVEGTILVRRGEDGSLWELIYQGLKSYRLNAVVLWDEDRARPVIIASRWDFPPP
ncbi:hypothetical protein JK364_53860 [Streptomyces sp. 110]|uniref:Resolvase/invertase-type recombinase catalytic domain-containing protein n=1 Tax=Streptomyces endocoffeicus TaxID=2898945 RepID=A0ABS1Q8P7_9ACTN|nr:hypothetical protein [Streptomyces endocoffeicus]MBL1121052.1 hypothetical protein [Streptomyces endocoffeicus]